MNQNIQNKLKGEIDEHVKTGSDIIRKVARIPGTQYLIV